MNKQNQNKISIFVKTNHQNFLKKQKKTKNKKNKTKIKTKQNFYQQIQDFAHH